jgi:hypothetical protein
VKSETRSAPVDDVDESFEEGESMPSAAADDDDFGAGLEEAPRSRTSQPRGRSSARPRREERDRDDRSASASDRPREGRSREGRGSEDRESRPRGRRPAPAEAAPAVAEEAIVPIRYTDVPTWEEAVSYLHLTRRTGGGGGRSGGHHGSQSRDADTGDDRRRRGGRGRGRRPSGDRG